MHAADAKQSRIDITIVETVSDRASVVPHQPPNICTVNPSDASRRINRADQAIIDAHQPTNTCGVSSTGHAARGIAVGDRAKVVIPNQPADVICAAHTARCIVAGDHVVVETN